MIEALIFDMDGLLIDSEPCWIQAEIEIFRSVGIPLTPEMCQQTTGLRIDAVVQHWYHRYPWADKTCQMIELEIVQRVAELVQHATPLPGVDAIIARARQRKLSLALCSSSPYLIIHEVVARLGLTDTFLVHSAMEEEYGKPHPAAYITTANRLKVAYNRCLVFEDSLNGAIAGKAAGMNVVAVPQGPLAPSTRFDFCDAKLTSLEEFTDEYLERLGSR